MNKEFKKVLCFEIISLLCTMTLTMISIGVSPFQKLGIILNSNNQITSKGTFIIWGIFALSAILTIMSLYTERKRTLNESKNVCTKERKKECKNIFSQQEMRTRYLNSLEDCSSVIILVRDLEHLLDKKQKKRIKQLRENCTILYSNCKKESTIEELKKVNVELHKISAEDNASKIKGQIVLGPNPQCIFTEKKKNKDFHLIYINNIFIQKAIQDNVEKVIKQLSAS